MSLTAQPDSLDPARNAVIQGGTFLWLVYTGLLTFRHAEGRAGTEVIPGVAERLPEVSADRKTYRFQLRQGVVYSDGAPVKASDFEHSLKRTLNMSGPFTSFLTSIEGTQEYIKAANPNGDISGVTADDKAGTVTIRLNAPSSTILQTLAGLSVGLVPGSTPFKDMTPNPPPGVGAFKITVSEPNQKFVVEKNERFDLPGIPKARLDSLTAVIVPNTELQAQQVMGGELDSMFDAPPADLLPIIREQYGSKGTDDYRYRQFPIGGNFFFFLNSALPPFNDKRVRQAVNFAVDRKAFAKIYGGLSDPACSFLPPTIPGAEPFPCPYGEKPDLKKARALIRQAGAEGAEVTVWGISREPITSATDYYAQVLDSIGLDPTEKIINGAVYYQTIGNASTKANTGYYSWVEDFPNPWDFFQLVSGTSIQPTNSINPGNVNDPKITREFVKLGKVANLSSVEDRWARMDRQLIEGAWVVPYGFTLMTTFMSPRMNFNECAMSHPLWVNDMSRWCLR